MRHRPSRSRLERPSPAWLRRRLLERPRQAPPSNWSNAATSSYLVFECLAERTIALAQQAKARIHAPASIPSSRTHGLCAACHGRGVTLVTNMGAANPHAAARLRA